METVRVKIATRGVKINRLFLIGNGFDLSLGLKTKYTDFLLWLFKKEVVTAIKSGACYAPFPDYKGRYDSFYSEHLQLKLNGFARNELFDVLIDERRSYIPIIEIERIKNFTDFNILINQYGVSIKTYKSSLLMDKLLENSKENWVDIENIYFELLKLIIRNKNSNKEYKDIIDNPLGVIK